MEIGCSFPSFPPHLYPMLLCFSSFIFSYHVLFLSTSQTLTSCPQLKQRQQKSRPIPNWNETLCQIPLPLQMYSEAEEHGCAYSAISVLLLNPCLRLGDSWFPQDCWEQIQVMGALASHSRSSECFVFLPLQPYICSSKKPTATGRTRYGGLDRGSMSYQGTELTVQITAYLHHRYLHK